ncbi:hypothetical protein [Achromobacter ruhlandii]|uniref:hypothetical protein n=1 Tax=Achromobacter ruhlandii TaxID=72557 RepID=UPI0007BEF437|nr:hypothetical protein [Achromobacter ruhlandii]
MTKPIDVRLEFTAPAGIAGVLRLQHDGGQSKTALLSMDRAGSLDYPTGSASLTVADMRDLVDGLMDAIHVIERQVRLSS